MDNSLSSAKAKITQFVMKYPLAIFGVMVVALLISIYYIYKSYSKKDKFNPTALLPAQMSDQVGVTASGLGYDYGTTYDTQSGSGIDLNLSSQQIMGSQMCGSNVLTTDDPWAYMVGELKSSEPFNPIPASQLMQIAAGRI